MGAEEMEGRWHGELADELLMTHVAKLYKPMAIRKMISNQRYTPSVASLLTEMVPKFF
jgi:hypothetical protein